MSCIKFANFDKIKTLAGVPLMGVSRPWYKSASGFCGGRKNAPTKRVGGLLNILNKAHNFRFELS